MENVIIKKLKAQIKTKRYHLTFIRMAIIKEKIARVGEELEKFEPCELLMGM